MSKYGFFPGCNIPAIRPDVERAIRLTMPGLGVELEELEGFTCCPAFGTFTSADEVASLAITAWNLAIADEKGVDPLVECGSCYSSLRLGRDSLIKSEEKKKKVNKLLEIPEKEFKGASQPRHLIDVLYNEVGVEKIASSITKPLEGLNAVVQYPCHTLWPNEVVGFDNPRRPSMLRKLVEALGASVQSYSREYQCCGGAGGFARGARIDAMRYTQKKLDAIINETKADFIVVSCITCLMHLDGMQKSLNEKGGKNGYSVPVFDYNQLLALCMGFEPKEVASISFIPRDEVIKRVA